MKKHSRISIICFLSLFTLLVLTPMVLSTTIGDTTFPAEVDKRYVWDITYPHEAEGYKIGFRANSITQGVHMTHESLIVYATKEGYIPAVGWTLVKSEFLYLAANETQDYLYFFSNKTEQRFTEPFVIPTPINLPLVAEALATAILNATELIFDYSIDDNTIIFNNISVNQTFEYTFNSEGFLTVAIEKFGDEMAERWELAVGGGGDEISFGIYFLVPIVSSIAAIVIFVKKRQSRIK
ncbi:MAG: hypothetical protein ACFFD2_20785 [Promethearchaeota archaeon]